MAIVIIRTAVIFITLLIIMRLMGKRQIGEMQPYELVITLLIADFACIPMADTAIPLLYGIISILTIYVLHQIVCLLDLKVKPFRFVISGKPAVVLNKNGIDDYELKKNNLDVSDLLESVRAAGYFSLAAIDYGIYEANGNFSAFPNDSFEGHSLPMLIISEGKYDATNLKFTHTERSFFDALLQERNVKLKHVLVLTLDGEGNVYLQCKGKKYESFQVELPKERTW